MVTGLLRQLRSAPARRSGAATTTDDRTGAAGARAGAVGAVGARAGAQAEAVAAVDAHAEPVGAGEPSGEERATPVTLVGQLRALSDEEDSGRTAPGRRICCGRCTSGSTTGSPSGLRCWRTSCAAPTGGSGSTRCG